MGRAVAETLRSALAFDDLRTFISASQQIDRWRVIEGADWNREIGALVEATAELIPDPPLLLFQNIKGYPSGPSVVSLLVASCKRAALAMGLPLEKSKLELVRLAARKVRDAEAIPPATVSTGPVMENTRSREDADLLEFPVLQFHARDGGRYIGTGDV